MTTIKIGKAILLDMLKMASVFDGGYQAVRLTAGAGKLSVKAIDLTFGGVNFTLFFRQVVKEIFDIWPQILRGINTPKMNAA